MPDSLKQCLFSMYFAWHLCPLSSLLKAILRHVETCYSYAVVASGFRKSLWDVLSSSILLSSYCCFRSKEEN